MRQKRLKLSAVILLGLGVTGLQAQESINTSGGNATGSGGSTSYSIGQVVYNTSTGDDGSVAQGVQQAFEISVLGVEDFEINPSLTAYPNPTADYLTLEVKELDYESLNFQLFDIQGKLLQTQKITNNQTNIVMSTLPVSTYFIKVNQGNKEVKTFKVIKN